MNRRHFVKLSATATAALLFSSITDANDHYPLINTPDEVWAKLDAEWFKLKRAGDSLFTFNDIEVSLSTNNNARGIYIQSPSQALTGIRLHWKHHVSATTKCLGDHWERTWLQYHEPFICRTF